MSHDYSRSDFSHSPYVVFYEVTQACDLVCRHCRACAQAHRHPHELDGAQAEKLIAELARFPKRPLLVLTGGDPIKRADIYRLIERAVGCGLETAMTPSATPLVTREALRRIREAGLARLAISLDGADAATHDTFRGVDGSFERTFEILSDARAAGLPLQVNTTVTRRNVDQVDAIAETVAKQRVVLWSVFFLVPVGRGQLEQRITPDEYERVFERLAAHAARGAFAVKTTEAPHYRRFLLQRRRGGGGQRGSADPMRRAPLGTNDGKGVLFISHIGEIFPSGFLPVVAGRCPPDSVIRVYQDSHLFRSLRDPNLLKGKCGACEYRMICGGSRARAYAVAGDPLAPEPDCVYEPAACSAGL